MIKERIKRIKTSLAFLKEIDKEFKVFGSSSHRYISKQLPEKEIVAFEEKEKIKLPENFRYFLLNLGYGAGPEYGIYSLEKIQEIYNQFCDILEIESSLSNSFELTATDAKELIEFKKRNPKKFHYKRLKTLGGVLPIQTGGCTYFSLLVLNGEQKGKIWAIDENEFDVLPAGVTKELDFLEWYEKWLRTSLEKVKSIYPENIIIKKEEKKKSLWSRLFE